MAYNRFNYVPSSTEYRDNKPLKKDFNIDKYDTDEIRRKCSKIEDFQTDVSSWAILWMCLSFLIIAILYEFFKWYSIIIWITGMIVLVYLSNRPYDNKSVYERIKKYDRALYEYNWWQNRKKVEFWFSLNGREFEIEIANIFRKLGYSARVCKQGGDKGIDINLSKLDGTREIVQCKAHKNKISPSVARDLYGTMTANNIDKAYLVTLNGATSGTIDFCRRHNIEVWDVVDIIKHQDNL